jgi:periplasmic divalent cation tolerance protein
MKNANEYRIVFVSTNSIENASHISRILVSENLAACCTLIPNTISFFSWADSIQERHECILMIKTHSKLLDMLSQRVVELHQDEVPEIISVVMSDSSLPYLNWMNTTLDINNL